MKNSNKIIIFWIAIFLGCVLAYDMLQGSNNGNVTKFVFSDFLTKIDQAEIRDLKIQGNNFEGHLSNGNKFVSYGPYYPELLDKLKSQGVRFEIVPNESKSGSFLTILASWMPLLIILGLLFYSMKQMGGAGSRGGALGFGKSKAKLLNKEKVKVTFDQVAGINESKEELTEIVEFLKDPNKFKAIGGEIPKGCLLVGHPGTGKTLLAKAIAGEANVPFFSISGSDFVEMFVGVGASRVRDMFEQGQKNAPCIIFIDEIDAVGRNRGIGLGGGNDEREQTLNQLLVEMDGFEANEGIIIIAATNRPDVLDPALLRPGRFDRQVIVPIPDLNGREAILNVHLKKIQLASGTNVRAIARGTPGFSGAELRNLVNEAALLAARRNMRKVTISELEEAKDKVMMGSERKSMKMSDDDKKLTAYHEGGHAIVAYHLPASDPIHKATIIPRGQALGMVTRLPENEKFSLTRAEMEANIAVAMGGRVAEEMIFGHDKVTNGASSDIKYATKLAKSMVEEWGLSDKVGPLFHGGEQKDQYLGGGSSRSNNSTDTSNIIDLEIKRIVNQGYQLAQELLKKHLKQLHLLAKNLLEYETLTGSEIDLLLKGKKIRINDDEQSKKPSILSSLPQMNKSPGNNGLDGSPA